MMYKVNVGLLVCTVILASCSSGSSDSDAPKENKIVFSTGTNSPENNADGNNSNQLNDETSNNSDNSDNIARVRSGSVTDESTTNRINPDSSAGKLVDSLFSVASISILDINEKLSTGQTLNDTEQACLADYDPALGEPITALQCSKPLSLDPSGVMKLYEATFQTSDNCRVNLMETSATACDLHSMALTLNTKINSLVTKRFHGEQPTNANDENQDTMMNPIQQTLK